MDMSDLLCLSKFPKDFELEENLGDEVPIGSEQTGFLGGREEKRRFKSLLLTDAVDPPPLLGSHPVEI